MVDKIGWKPLGIYLGTGESAVDVSNFSADCQSGLLKLNYSWNTQGLNTFFLIGCQRAKPVVHLQWFSRCICVDRPSGPSAAPQLGRWLAVMRPIRNVCWRQGVSVIPGDLGCTWVHQGTIFEPETADFLNWSSNCWVPDFWTEYRLERRWA